MERQIIEPSFDSLPDHTIIYKFAKKLGFVIVCLETLRSIMTSLLLKMLLVNGTVECGQLDILEVQASKHEYQHFDKTTLQAVGGIR